MSYPPQTPGFLKLASSFVSKHFDLLKDPSINTNSTHSDVIFTVRDKVLYQENQTTGVYQGKLILLNSISSRFVPSTFISAIVSPIYRYNPDGTPRTNDNPPIDLAPYFNFQLKVQMRASQNFTSGKWKDDKTFIIDNNEVFNYTINLANLVGKNDTINVYAYFGIEPGPDGYSNLQAKLTRRIFEYIPLGFSTYS